MEWFKNVFLKSFEDCKGKRISEKQAEIFQRYLPETRDSNFNAFYYVGTFNNRNIEVQESKVYNGCSYSTKGRHTNYRTEYYLTITTNEI